MTVVRTARYSSAWDFSVAMKAAAWEAQALHAWAQTGDHTHCVRHAAHNLGIVDMTETHVNVDDMKIREIIFKMAFRQPDRTEVHSMLAEAWREYAGMGAKAAA